jgi:hypothetical protein
VHLAPDPGIVGVSEEHMTRALALTATLLIGPLALLVDAHDFWLTATPQPGESAVSTITVAGHLGERFPEADAHTTPASVASWRVIGPAGERDVRPFAQAGLALATQVALPPGHTYLGVMAIHPMTAQMRGDEFLDYLEEEGLHHVIWERGLAGLAMSPALERYTRFAKVIIGDGGGDTAHLLRPAGQHAELVPLRNPATVGAGGLLAVQFLVAGKPVGGAQISALSNGIRLNARTDSEGIAGFTLPRDGAWLIRTVHMERAAIPGSDIEWESYWASLAFEAAGAAR